MKPATIAFLGIGIALVLFGSIRWMNTVVGLGLMLVAMGALNENADSPGGD